MLLYVNVDSFLSELKKDEEVAAAFPQVHIHVSIRYTCSR